jgi:hypothetical protein
LAQLNRLPIGAIAIDTEFQFASDPVDLGRPVLARPHYPSAVDPQWRGLDEGIASVVI